MTRSDRTPEVPVVIAGAGPAGLVAAITLARSGVGSLLVERNPSLSPLPRATGVSVRTMELLRSWGLEDEVRAGQLDLGSARGFATGSLASPEGTAVPAGFPDFEEAAAAGPGLLDSYEAEWRPVGARRAARSTLEGWEPPGPEALAEDLNGRLGHAWLAQANGHRRSTLDLLGQGLTLLAGHGGRAWADAGATLDTAFPLDVRPVDADAAAALGVHPDGAVLARPDAQVIAQWPSAPPDPRAELAAATSGWVEGGPVSSGAGTGRWRRGRRP